VNVMQKRLKTPLIRSAQRGVTMLIVLVLLSVMLLGGLALARLTEVGTLTSGNNAYHEAAMQATEVGLNTAYVAVRNLADENTSSGTWYSATQLPKDANGLPTIDWSTAPSVTVGMMTVRYVAERACTVTPVTAPLRECLVKQVPPPIEDYGGGEKPDPQNSRQFRVTVRVEDQKGTQTFVQSLITKGVTVP